MYINVQVIPEELRIKWQAEVEALDAKLGGAPDKPISSLLLMLEAPEEMVVACSAGMWLQRFPFVSSSVFIML